MPSTDILQALSDNIVIDKDKCVFCATCVDTCILDNLRLKLSPCRQGCPLGVNVQGYVQEIGRGRDDRAREIVRQKAFLPEVLGRICPAPCEASCHHKVMDGEAVSIRALKRYLFEGQNQADIPMPEMAEASGKKVAVVGSGPAGLQAAYDLLSAGHAVTAFEAENEPGGMMRWAIPEFRLPTDVLQKELSLLKKMGVEFRCGMRLGRDLTLDNLQSEYDAVVLATGCSVAMSLGVDGETTPGVFSGLNILGKARNGNAPALSGHAVVIGGGNVAVDSAQVALRLGAEKVTLVSLEAEDQLPAFEQDVKMAREEGVVFLPSWGVSRFIAEKGRLAGVELMRCTSVFDSDGNFMPRYDDCRLETIEADSVIVAIGQHREAQLFERLSLIDEITLQSGGSNLFVAGDCHSGPSSVVQAMASGREAAESVKRLLAGEHLHFGRTYEGPVETEYEIDTSSGSTERRVAPDMRPFTGKADFDERESAYSQDQARQEASRCYSCGGPFGKHRTCWFCLPCEVECPEDALSVEIPYLLR